MLSYVIRRRRWWKLLKSLDSSIELSEPMRVELLLELSGLSRQECLVIKACTSDSRRFEAVGATLVEHYSGVHLKEGRSLGGGTFPDRRHARHGARARSNSTKAKSKCLRCGAIGHWAGDPECKFPTAKGGKPQGKGRAHIAIVAPRQCRVARCQIGILEEVSASPEGA